MTCVLCSEPEAEVAVIYRNVGLSQRSRDAASLVRGVLWELNRYVAPVPNFSDVLQMRVRVSFTIQYIALNRSHRIVWHFYSAVLFNCTELVIVLYSTMCFHIPRTLLIDLLIRKVIGRRAEKQFGEPLYSTRM